MVFWHDKQFATITLLSKFGIEKRAGLVSASRDGDMLASWIKRLGYHVVRGSSSKKALSSLVNLLAAAKEGYSFGIAADGPRGPQFVAKSGLSFLAYKAGLQSSHLALLILQNGNLKVGISINYLNPSLKPSSMLGPPLHYSIQ